MYKILIIEDDVKIRDELKILLSKYGYDCVVASDFENIIDDVIASNAQLVLLDINLPVFDGYYICKKIRERSNVPIIIVTSRNNEIDELMSMNLGADDFITKPYNMQILLARIATILKRVYHTGVSKTLFHNGLSLEISKSLAQYSNSEIELTKNEMRILHTLMNNKGLIVSRDELMNELWQSDEFVDDNTLTVNINRLRKKLENIGATNYIKTKRGQGYMI